MPVKKRGVQTRKNGAGCETRGPARENTSRRHRRTGRTLEGGGAAAGAERCSAAVFAMERSIARRRRGRRMSRRRGREAGVRTARHMRRSGAGRWCGLSGTRPHTTSSCVGAERSPASSASQPLRRDARRCPSSLRPPGTGTVGRFQVDPI